MALSDTQVRQLRAKLDAKHVKKRNANGTDLHYVEGWHVIAEANRIFGYDAWDRRTSGEPLCVERALGRLSRRSLHRQGPCERPSRRCHDCAGGIRDRGRQGPYPRGKLTSLRSKVPRLMPPSGRSLLRQPLRPCPLRLRLKSGSSNQTQLRPVMTPSGHSSLAVAGTTISSSWPSACRQAD